MDLELNQFQLPPVCLRIVVQNLTAAEIVQIARCSKSFFHQLLGSEQALYILKQVIARDLDLPYKTQMVNELNIHELIRLYHTTLSAYKSEMGHFVGFKCSQGSDQFPNDYYGCQWLFLRGKRAVFSSDVNDGPVMITGIYKTENLIEWLQQNSILNRILSIEVRELKVKRRQYDSELTEKYRQIRLLCMTFFRNVQGAEMTDQNIEQVLYSHYNPIAKHIQKLARKDCKTPSVANMKNIALEYTKQVWTAMNQFMEHEIFINNDLDQDKTFDVRTVLPKYYELKHTIQHNDLFLVRSFHIDQLGPDNDGLTCPAKTIAIYAHQEDFSYKDLPSIIKVTNACRTIEEVHLQQYQNNLPPSIMKPKQNNQCQIATIELFNTLVQQKAQVKLIAWIQIPRYGYQKHQSFEVVLQRAFATKYITVSLIDCENYLQAAGDFYHTQTNIDMKSISFFGTRILTDRLFEKL